MDPVTDSAGRVTRSLRKRIPSVDSENSSRPGTPVPSKLTAITEISSPSRPTRITRRNSISGVATPSKTPVKRVGATTSVISETTESVTPARRSTRRRSVSINESEGTPKAVLKAQAFVTLVEEVPTNIKQTVVKLMRLQTQSPEQKEAFNSPDDRIVKTKPKSLEQEAETPEKIMSMDKIMKTNGPVGKQVKTESKSPQQSRINSSEQRKSVKPKLQQRQKLGPKCKTRLLTDEMDDLSDVEVVVLEKESINEIGMKTNLSTINLIDDEDGNVPQQISHANLADISSNQIKDIVKSPQSSQSSECSLITVIDLVECDDGQKLDSTKNFPAQEIQQNVTNIELMESDGGQQIDNTDKLPAEEVIKKAINPAESYTTDSEISKINVEINNEITQNTVNVNEEPTTMTKIESKTEDMNEEISIELKPLETESSVVISKTYLNESKSKKNPTEGNPENMKPEDTSVKNEVWPSESKFKEVTIENKKQQETLQIECEVIINETLNGSKAEENLAKETLENNIEEDNKSQSIIEINNETVDSTKYDLSSGDLDCTSTQTDEIIPSITINDDSRIGSKVDVEENYKICTTPQQLPQNSTATIIEVIHITPTQFESNASGCKSSKKVEFISSPSGDDIIKCVYPRTPAFIKSKSSIEVESTQNMKQPSNEETVNSLMLNMNEIGETSEQNQEHQKDNEGTISICEEISEMEVDKNKIVQDGKQTIIKCATETPSQNVKNVQQLKISQSSTPIIVDTSKTKDEDLQQLTDNEVKQYGKSSLKKSIMTKYPDKKLDGPESLDSKLENINIKSTSVEKNETELKWINPYVKGNTTEGGKLDGVVKSKETPEKRKVNEEHEIEEEHTSQTRRINAIIFSSESEGEEESMTKDDDEEEELAVGEKPLKRKHVFHDDEAMEVEDYESGDSMDAEERCEMLENEVPVDGESIGSNTTDEEHDDIAEDGEESENDSFIVSDNDEEENFQLECSEDSNDEDDLVDDKHDQKKKKIYKRIQRPNETTSSSSSNELEEEKEEEDENDTDKKIQSNTVNSPTKNINNSIIKSSGNNDLDLSKLSDTALRLQCTGESDSGEHIEERNENISRKEILRKLNQSERFNKSVRYLNPEVETSPIEHNNGTQTESNSTNIRDNKIDLQNSISLENSMNNEENEERSNSENDDEKQQEAEKKSCTDEVTTSSSSSDENVVVKKISKEKQAELSHLGEVSVTTESDNDKENTKNNKLPLNRSRLSESFGYITKPKKQSTQRRSFTIGVSLKRGDLEAEIKATKKIDSPSTSTPSLPSSPSPNTKQDDELSSDDTRYLENIKHMPLPLGHPLVRTRRQSLALPTNPDMEICSSTHGAASGSGINKKKRKSLGILSGNEFNPSQSFIDSMELRKNEFDRQAAKRKRLSKSFCGAADTKDNSVIDIDVRHLHKRSKLSADNSIITDNYDSMENINSSKLSTKATISSTPREKTFNNDSNNNVQRILNRCEEILEAANHAKLQAKLKNKKIKAKAPKKNRKKTTQQSIRELHQDSDAKRKSITKDNNNQEKTKAALAEALKAADIIIRKKKQKVYQTVKQDSDDSKRLSSDILKAISKSEHIMKKKKKRDVHNENKMLNYHTTSTAAGNFVDMPQTPEKKKKKVKIMQLPTGKVCVEPITPKHRPVLAGNGTVFRESPITPLTVGFKVSHIPCDEYRASILKDGKRKRNFDNLTGRTLPKPQWTQSGLFIEEEIPTMRRIAGSEVSQFSGSWRLNKHQTINDQHNAHWNFKENAIKRHDVKRCTNREILQLKERRQIQSQF